MTRHPRRRSRGEAAAKLCPLSPELEHRSRGELHLLDDIGGILALIEQLERRCRCRTVAVVDLRPRLTFATQVVVDLLDRVKMRPTFVDDGRQDPLRLEPTHLALASPDEPGRGGAPDELFIRRRGKDGTCE
jgi:hypothetical protein